MFKRRNMQRLGRKRTRRVYNHTKRAIVFCYTDSHLQKNKKWILKININWLTTHTIKKAMFDICKI